MQDWLAARAQVTPDRIALTVNGEYGNTYANLYQQAHLRANAMQSAHPSIKKGTHVALLGDSGIRTVYTIHALIHIGAVIVPLNTRLTVEELAFQVRQAECLFVLYDEYRYRETALRLDLPDVHVLSYSEACTTEKVSPHSQHDLRLDDPFAIIHTSGTSGRPKGAVLTYGNIFYSAMASAYRLGHLPDDCWLCVLPLYHVGGLSIIMRAVLHGVTVDLHPRFDVEAVNRALDTQPITLISLVPTMLHRLLESRCRWPDSLRLILLGGAAAPPELLARCREVGLPVATTYGLTEAASQVATMLPDDVNRKPGSVGRPLLFTSVKIIDEHGEPAAPGEYGEIVVSGPTVMQGYFNDPEATARVLRNGELHTGDIGYLDDDGDLFVVQRRSDLIVSGGENVYPAEVEQAIRAHPAVVDACVVGLDDEDWGQRVAAAVIVADGAALTEAELIAFCRERLAGYKLPRRVLLVDALPQTASGKVSHAAVKDLFVDNT
jgi:o-succinylbenzoate---CoA ligase